MASTESQPAPATLRLTGEPDAPKRLLDSVVGRPPRDSEGKGAPQAASDDVHPEFRDAAAARGKGLAERLRGISGSNTAATSSLQLHEVRGNTGTMHEGLLAEISDSDCMCCFGSKTSCCFFVVKGPWMLKFKKGDDKAKTTGLPIPLDGATVTAIGEVEFEVSNLHIKEDFYGKDTLQKMQKDARKSFQHSIHRLFVAPSRESRDEWVQQLEAQIDKLSDLLARKLQNSTAGKPTVPRDLTTESTAVVNSVYASLFDEFERDLEVSVFKLEVNMYCSSVAGAGGPPRVVI